MTDVEEVSQIITTITSLQTKINHVNDEFNNYIKYLKDRDITIDESVEDEERLAKSKEILTKIDKFAECKKNLYENTKQAMETVKGLHGELKKLMRRIALTDEEMIIETNNKVIDFIQEKNEEKKKSEIEKLQQQIKEIEEKYKNEHDTLQAQRIQHGQYKLLIDGILDSQEREQIMKWTEMQLDQVIFDSSIHEWKANTPGLNDTLLKKENLLFLIEDTIGNTFGGFLKRKIEKEATWINDSNAFLFTLRSNGRIDEMMKYEIKEPKYAFYLYDKSQDRFFGFGYGSGHSLTIFKANRKSLSYCDQNDKYFNYHNIPNALCGTTHPDKMTLKRVVIIQMK